MNLFEKQNKPFAIKLSERVKEEIKKEFVVDFSNYKLAEYFIFISKDNWTFSLNKPPHTLITEAEFFGDGSNKLKVSNNKKHPVYNCEFCQTGFSGYNFCSGKCDKSIKNKKGERIIRGISEVHLAELERDDILKKQTVNELREKIENIKFNITHIDFEGFQAMATGFCFQKNIDQLEQITDDFAVNFAEWLNIQYRELNHTLAFREKTLTELLQIFKTQVYGK